MSISVSSIYHIIMVIFGVAIFFKHRVKLEKSSLALIFFSIVIVCSTIYSNLVHQYPLKPILKIKYFLIPIISISSLNLFLKSNTDTKSKRLYTTLLISATLASLSGLYAYSYGFHPIRFKDVLHMNRASGMFGMVMSYAHSISFLSTILLGILIKRIFKFEKRLELYTLTTLLISLTGLTFSLTRGAWLGFLISVPFLFIEKNNSRKIIKATLAIICICIGISQIKLIQKTFISRIESNNQRISFFKAAFEGFKESPILGLGYRQFEPQSSRLKKKAGLSFSNIKGHAHNNYLEHLASLGSLGLIAFVLFLLFWGFEMWNNFTPINQVFFAFFINFLASGLTQYTFGDGECLFFIMACYTITQVINLQTENPVNTLVTGRDLV